MHPVEQESTAVDIASQLRELREAQGLSMRSLAQKSGLSANALSMIERGKTSPSVSTLYKIADALEVPITSFFAPSPARKQIVFVRSNERTHIPLPGGTWDGLGGEHFIGRVEPFILTLEIGAGSGERSMEHKGHEFVFCLSGNIQYKVEDEDFLMESGDSLLFSAHLEHNWRNVGKTTARLLIVLSNFQEGDRSINPHLEHS